MIITIIIIIINVINNDKWILELNNTELTLALMYYRPPTVPNTENVFSGPRRKTLLQIVKRIISLLLFRNTIYAHFAIVIILYWG